MPLRIYLFIAFVSCARVGWEINQLQFVNLCGDNFSNFKNLYKWNIYLYLNKIISRVKWTVFIRFLTVTFLGFHIFLQSSLARHSYNFFFFFLISDLPDSTWSWDRLCRRPGCHFASNPFIFREVFPFWIIFMLNISFLTWNDIKQKAVHVPLNVINESQTPLTV